MRNNEYEIRAVWDNDAEVWVAESKDVPGLVAEADTMDVLRSKLRTLIPELLELNGKKTDASISYSVSFDYHEIISA